MRMRVSKLVYLPVGGALGAGLLVSAFVMPQPKLTAASDCYSSCNSATTLSLSTSSVVAGRESEEKFRVTVTGDAFGTAKPTGSVDVETDGKLLCHFDLSGGKGDCSLGAHELPGGSYEIEAHYNGDDDLSPSTSGRKHLDVTKGSSRATLELSKSTVAAGREAEEDFRVTVTADDSLIGKATGRVDIESDGKVLCHFDLVDGAGRCSLGAHELPGGSYEIDAHYVGDDDLTAANSERKHLDVTKGSSRADLTLSKSTITDGNEAEEDFRVTVTADDSLIGKATGRVDIESDGKVLCDFKLADGAGHCSLGEKELKAGSYEIDAHYVGDDDLTAANSDRRHLDVKKG
jgi:Bacterial Ig-like domain (group 3)